ncbi:hypothetical protein JCM19039_1562 [Geomicrobium sp. JCM 19039]|nr:hypothetical protein JCM19039_1562 [Geomicrobium sp. JCM 19039]
MVQTAHRHDDGEMAVGSDQSFDTEVGTYIDLLASAEHTFAAFFPSFLIVN